MGAAATCRTRHGEWRWRCACPVMAHCSGSCCGVGLRDVGAPRGMEQCAGGREARGRRGRRGWRLSPPPQQQLIPRRQRRSQGRWPAHPRFSGGASVHDRSEATVVVRSYIFTYTGRDEHAVGKKEGTSPATVGGLPPGGRDAVRRQPRGRARPPRLPRPPPQ